MFEFIYTIESCTSPVYDMVEAVLGPVEVILNEGNIPNNMVLTKTKRYYIDALRKMFGKDKKKKER